MTRTNTILLAVAVASAGCTANDSSVPNVDPRDWVYTVDSEVDGETIVSDVYRDGRLVVVATLDGDASVVTLIDSGKEVSGQPPTDYDPRVELERYEETIVNVSTALSLSEVPQASSVGFRGYVPEMNADQSAFRSADACGYVPFPTVGGYCIASWCGPSCFALDCVGVGSESHFISGCGT